MFITYVDPPIGSHPRGIGKIQASAKLIHVFDLLGHDAWNKTIGSQKVVKNGDFMTVDRW